MSGVIQSLKTKNLPADLSATGLGDAVSAVSVSNKNTMMIKFHETVVKTVSKTQNMNRIKEPSLHPLSDTKTIGIS